MRVELGQEVRCKITGFKGIAVARTEFINGCVQYNVAPKWDKAKANNPMEQEISIDETSLELVNREVRFKYGTEDGKPKKKIRKKETGGPTRLPFKQRGY